MTTDERRFWSRVDKTEECWLWTGTDNGKGYGRIVVNNQRTLAHRLAYELLVGPIPEGLTLDHLCGVKRCVKVEHLEPVTLRENVLRGSGPPARNARKSHCWRGHPLSGTNLYIRPSGKRECRSCANEARRRYKKKRHA